MIEPDSKTFSAYGAVEFCKAGDWTGLIAYAQRWRDSDPANYYPHFYLGIGLSNMGMMNAAIESYERAIAINSGDPILWGNLANVVGEFRGFNEAEKYHQAAVRVGPDHAVSHYNYGTLLGQHGRPSEAVEMLRIALALNPKCPETLSCLIAAYNDLADFESIRDLLPVCQDLFPDRVPELRQYLASKGIR